MHINTLFFLFLFNDGNGYLYGCSCGVGGLGDCGGCRGGGLSG